MLNSLNDLPPSSRRSESECDGVINSKRIEAFALAQQADAVNFGGGDVCR